MHMRIGADASRVIFRRMQLQRRHSCRLSRALLMGWMIALAALMPDAGVRHSASYCGDCTPHYIAAAIMPGRGAARNFRFRHRYSAARRAASSSLMTTPPRLCQRFIASANTYADFSTTQYTLRRLVISNADNHFAMSPDKSRRRLISLMAAAFTGIHTGTSR